MQNTSNLNLYLPSRLDKVPVDETLAENFRIIDEELGSGLIDEDGTKYPDLAARLERIVNQINAKPTGILRGKPYMHIAHRGLNGAYPENTLTSFAAAIDAGFDALETDVQPTSDGGYVIIHDETVDRTTDGIGAVRDLTLAQIRALDAGSKYSPDFAGLQIPTFDEYLEIIRNNNVVGFPEFKGVFTQAQIDDLVRMVVDYKLEDDIAFIGFGTENISMVRNTNQRIKLGLLTGSFTQANVDFVKNLGNAFLDVDNTTVTAANMAMAEAAGIEVGAWTIDNSTTLRNVIKLGVKYITTDDITNTGRF